METFVVECDTFWVPSSSAGVLREDGGDEVCWWPLIWFVQCGWLSSWCGKILLEAPRSHTVRLIKRTRVFPFKRSSGRWKFRLRSSSAMHRLTTTYETVPLLQVSLLFISRRPSCSHQTLLFRKKTCFNLFVFQLLTIYFVFVSYLLMVILLCGSLSGVFNLF